MDQECSRLPKSFDGYRSKLTLVSSFARQGLTHLESAGIAQITGITVFACPAFAAPIHRALARLVD
jgi:hypothetical protein